MPNTNSPYGLLPLGVQNNATPAFQLSRTQFPPGAVIAAARGDLVVMDATGYLLPKTIATVLADTPLIRGIIWGFEFLSTALGRRIPTQYYPGVGSATGDVEMLYVPMGVDYPSIQFRAQAATVPFTRDMVNNTFNTIYTAPSALLRGGSSQVAMATAAPAVTALPFRLVKLWTDIARDGAQDDASNFNWGVFEFNNSNSAGI